MKHFFIVLSLMGTFSLFSSEASQQKLSYQKAETRNGVFWWENEFVISYFDREIKQEATFLKHSKAYHAAEYYIDRSSIYYSAGDAEEIFHALAKKFKQ